MNVREAAVAILERVDEGAYLNITLNHFLNENLLSRVDADLLTRLVYSVKSHQITLNYHIAPYIEGKRVRPFEKRVLLVACCQSLYFDKIPDYAIIDESVEMVKKKRGPKAAGFINAVLRQIVKNKEINLNIENELEKISIMYSHPLWLVKMLDKQYGRDILIKILEENQSVPLLSARVNTLKTSKQEILNNYPNIKEGKFASNSIYFESGNIANTKLYKEGLVTVQDEASQWVVEQLPLKEGMKVLDMCSAPGSKTTHLAAKLNNTGEIHAYDLYEHKIQLIESNANRLGCTNIQAKAYDSTKLLEIEQKESFDAILLDGPCSGLGVLARKPEIRYHDANIMDELIQIQYELLKTAYQLLKKGGVMVYSTCTLNKKENRKNIDRFLALHPDMHLQEDRTILPYEYHSDGFYMARLVKDDEN